MSARGEFLASQIEAGKTVGQAIAAANALGLKGTVAVLTEALERIAALGPEAEPHEEDYDDPANYAEDNAAWQAAQIAREALKGAL